MSSASTHVFKAFANAAMPALDVCVMCFFVVPNMILVMNVMNVMLVGAYAVKKTSEAISRPSWHVTTL